jgi:Fe-S cluster assembly protein SufD
MIESLGESSRERRTAAFERFEAASMPTQKLEQWKYVDLGFDLKQVPIATEPGAPLGPGPFLGSIADREATVVVIDGTVTEIVSGSEADIRKLSDLDAAQVDRVDSLIDIDRDIFASARAAFAPDAVVVTAPRGATVSKPVVIDLQATSATSSFPRVTVIAEENAEIGVIVMFRSAPGAAAVMAPQIGLHAETGARIRYVAVQNVAFEATAVVHQKVEIGRDATVRTGEVGLGGHVGRLDLDVELDGQGSSAEVLGVYFGEHDQTLDYRMLIHHKGKNSSSDVFLKGAVEDDAQSVFTGLLKIDKGAERTSAFETNRNLVLSEGAKAHSVPNLEIECDDVVCGHGSSVGPLETEHLYYLRSRGLSAERAERLMIKGFFNEIIDRLPVAGLAEPVREELFGRFIEAQREGRVA